MSRPAVADPKSTTAQVLFPELSAEKPCQSSAQAVLLTVQVEGSSALPLAIPLPSAAFTIEPFPSRLSPWWNAVIPAGITMAADAVPMVIPKNKGNFVSAFI